MESESEHVAQVQHDVELQASTVPMVHPTNELAMAPKPNRRFRRVLQASAALGLAAGVAVGATALASAATGSNSNGGNGGTSSSGSSTSKGPGGARHFFGIGGPAAFGGPLGFGGMGPVIHGEATVKGPSGAYETIEFQTGTVTSLTDVSGSTWKLIVTSADKTALTYTVNSGTSVNGGETGVSSIKAGDQVTVTAVVAKGTATAKTLTDTSMLKANRASWAPMTRRQSSTPSTSSGSQTS